MTDITHRASELHDKWLAFGGKISQETAEVLAQLRAEVDEARRCGHLVRDLLNPERFGHAVNAEIRDAARVALGLPASETAPPPATAESFNEDTAKRDAIAFRAVPYPRSRR